MSSADSTSPPAYPAPYGLQVQLICINVCKRGGGVWKIVVWTTNRCNEWEGTATLRYLEWVRGLGGGGGGGDVRTILETVGRNYWKLYRATRTRFDRSDRNSILVRYGRRGVAAGRVSRYIVEGEWLRHRGHRWSICNLSSNTLLSAVDSLCPK